MLAGAITFCIIYTLVLNWVCKLKLKSLQNDRDDLVEWGVTRAKFIVDKTNELNKNSAYLDAVVKKLINQKRYNDEKFEEVKQIHIDNAILFESNRETLKENKIQLHNIRESYIFTYHHYKSMSEMFRNLLIFDDGESPLFGHIRNAMQTVHANMNETVSRFKRYFRMTPEQYLNRKTSLMGKRPNGTDYVSDFSAS